MKSFLLKFIDRRIAKWNSEIKSIHSRTSSIETHQFNRGFNNWEDGSIDELTLIIVEDEVVYVRAHQKPTIDVSEMKVSLSLKEARRLHRAQKKIKWWRGVLAVLFPTK